MFKKGDRVIFSDNENAKRQHIRQPNYFPKPGTHGIVLDESEVPFVQWEKGSTSGDDIWAALQSDLIKEEKEKMSCNCKHEKEKIREEQKLLDLFEKYFIRRMTVDNSHDRRRRDYNQSIFGKWEEDEDKPSNYSQMWTEMTMDMVLQCFDDAKKDFSKRFCDEHEKTMFEEGFENEG